MNKTLLILSTHFVGEDVISEYMKMLNTPNVDAILAIDNTAYKYDFTERIENKNFYGLDVNCFFFDSKLHDEMKLPYFTSNGVKGFDKVMWNNGDYRFYYVRKFFSDYDYYWQFDYDVFCNAKTYEGFLKKTSDKCEDLLIKSFSATEKESIWCLDWAYKDTPLYKSFFPAVRLSARAVDFLYKRRLEHAKIFHEDGGKNKWIFSELFTPTELMNNGFSCADLDEPNIRFKPNFYLNDDRFFLTPDDKLYHPVKSVKKEISNLQSQLEDLKLKLRKNFLTTLVKSLNKFDLPHKFSADFKEVVMPILSQEKIYYTAKILQKSIYIALHCEENFSDINISELIKNPTLLGFRAMKKENQLSLFTLMPDEMDDVTRVAVIMKNLIAGTYPVIKKNSNIVVFKD